jgi:antitoxin component YwqK of YwqJK toxin-antitoxin module
VQFKDNLPHGNQMTISSNGQKRIDFYEEGVQQNKSFIHYEKGITASDFTNGKKNGNHI